MEIEIADLRGHFNIFELVGPKSSQVIHGILKLANPEERQSVRKVRRVISNNVASYLMSNPPQFWNELETLQSPGSVPRGMVIGLKVNDPRLK